MKYTTRREALKHIAWFSVAMSLDHAHAQTGSANAWIKGGDSNFKAIYGNPETKAAFLLFLRNVYNLFPEDEFHKLIDKATQQGRTDKEIYQLIQAQIGTITPFLSEVRYALPALRKQKAEMTRQTMSLLEQTKQVKGYMEIGSPGRYVSELKTKVAISGDIVLLHSDEPSYSMVDMMERGGIGKLGRFVAMNDYAPIAEKDVPDASLDLVGNYVGIHHAPLDKRDAFVKSIARILRPGGRLILRDHDVNSMEMRHMVALAHDVFNAGLGTDWRVNQQEIRNFTGTMQLIDYLGKFGLKVTARKGQILQAGDPTRNALIEFVKA